MGEKLKLFYGGYGFDMYYVVAVNEHEAIEKIQEQYNMAYLPVEAKEITVEDFDIVLESIETVEDTQKEETPKEIKLEKLNKAQLQAIATEKGIEFTEKTTNKELVASIKAVS